ncbi:hypothetical protein [Paracerasibacillus soli]|uniref:Uncharacterized protein n=1 Tax=Paracerasibacillus soli TaxID=480284 RepID=A0ABU5CUY4_9BACI|nr:hypothetical protein [Virgibacillus soli]MDY0410131.1 hypothetical protein [Virgibacillus soli]
MDLKAYSTELKKINDKIEQLQAKNKEAINNLNALETEYETAVANMQDEKADHLHQKKYEIEQTINNRKNKINILQNKNNPRLERAATETIKAYYAEREKQLQEAVKLVKELERVKEQYFKLCGQLRDINEKHSRIKKKLDEPTRPQTIANCRNRQKVCS